MTTITDPWPQEERKTWTTFLTPPATSQVTFRYKGVQRNGGRAMGDGLNGATLAEFVEAKFNARWRSLTVTRNGIEVGGIGPSFDDGKRIWWAEKE